MAIFTTPPRHPAGTPPPAATAPHKRGRGRVRAGCGPRGELHLHSPSDHFRKKRVRDTHMFHAVFRTEFQRISHSPCDYLFACAFVRRNRNWFATVDPAAEVLAWLEKPEYRAEVMDFDESCPLFPSPTRYDIEMNASFRIDTPQVSEIRNFSIISFVQLSFDQNPELRLQLKVQSVHFS